MPKNRRTHRPPQGAKSKPKQPRARDNRPTQAERFETIRQAKRRRAVVTRAAVIAVVVVIVGGVVVWRAAGRRAADRTIATMTAGTCRYDTKTDSGRTNQHSDAPAFKVHPPAGGVHLPSAASAGIYTQETAPPPGQIVHALEHGGIALWYDPALPPAKVRSLQDLADARTDDVLLVPQSGLKQPVAATAWHRRLLCGEVEVKSLRRFVDAYRGNGPEKGARLK